MKKNRKSEKEQGIEWPALIPGTLMKRYKRFLADVQLNDGRMVTAHCPNSGKMTACAEPGRPVYLSCHDNPKRKLKYTWEMIDMPDSLVGVNTLIPNKLVKNAIENGLVDELKTYDQVVSEVRVGQGSRLDLMLRKENGDSCFLEVKNCTLVEGKTAYFPDAVTARGRKHLLELQRLASEGNRCAMFYLIQRMDAEQFKPADHIDPAYGKELRQAYKNGVEILVYDVKIDLKRIRLNRQIPFSLEISIIKNLV
jgi:sugar fermentation stimulation protein A